MATIKKLERKQVTTSYGEKEKFIVTIEQDGKSIMADSFCGKWNSDWREGLEIEIKKEQWKSREYNGKTYWSIMAPPEARGGFINPKEITDLKIKVDGQEAIINEMVKFISKYKPMLEKLSEQAEQTDENTIQLEDEMSIGDSEASEDEINLNDIPF